MTCLGANLPEQHRNNTTSRNAMLPTCDTDERANKRAHECLLHKQTTNQTPASPTHTLPDIMTYLRAVPAASSSNALSDNCGGASVVAAAAGTTDDGVPNRLLLFLLLLRTGMR